MQVRPSFVIREDLQEISDYIAKHNPTRALSFVEELETAMWSIGDNPFLFHLRPEYGPETRALIHGRYLILFRIVQDIVFVDRVIHSARNAARLR